MEKKYAELEKKPPQKEMTIRLLIAALIAMAIIQIATVAVIIYLGARVGDLSSDVDDVESAQSLSQQSSQNNNNGDSQVREAS